MNFERLRLQIHMRGLYERLGAMDAELLIVDAFLREQARHEAMPQQTPAGRSVGSVACTPNGETRDSISR